MSKRYHIVGKFSKKGVGKGGEVEIPAFRQVDGAFDQVLFNKPFADFLFLVRARVAASTGSRAGVQNHDGPAIVLEA